MSKIVVSFFTHLNSRDPSPIYVISAVKVFVLLFSFSILMTVCNVIEKLAEHGIHCKK